MAPIDRRHRSWQAPPRGGPSGHRRRNRAGRRPSVSRPLLVLAAALFAAGWHQMQAERSRKPDFVAQRAVPAAPVALGRGFPLCGHGLRSNCVVDGDTFWIDGEKIRIANIDAPEIEGRFVHESRLAQRAKMRLSVLLTGSPIALSRQGRDRYGRTLAAVAVGSDDAGRILVREGLAQPWRGRKAVWCG